jgi:hypothetical protein
MGSWLAAFRFGTGVEPLPGVRLSKNCIIQQIMLVYIGYLIV